VVSDGVRVERVATVVPDDHHPPGSQLREHAATGGVAGRLRSAGLLRPARALKARIVKRRAARTVRRECRRRARFIERARGITPHVAVEREGAVFFLPTRQKAGLDRFAKSEWKEKRHLQRALQALTEAGAEVRRTTFVDVGAHVGTTTITAVRRFGFRSALAFEPELNNFRLLRANVGVNGLEGVIRTLNVAVSDRLGSAELALQPENGTKHHLLTPHETTSKSVRVPLTTLDAFVEQGGLDPGEAGLVWLDVEGHELEVLQGASRLIERSVPLVMEFDPRRLQDQRLDALRSLLENHYTHLADLRLRRTKNGSPVWRVGAMRQLAESYECGFTDLLVFRLIGSSHSGLPSLRLS
jgi:FkbM family methyltransferase